MQDVEDDRNSQLRKDEVTPPQKKESQRKYGMKTKMIFSLMRPFDGEELLEISWPTDTMGAPAESHATPSQKMTLEKRERPRIRCHGPARGHTCLMLGLCRPKQYNLVLALFEAGK